VITDTTPEDATRTIAATNPGTTIGTIAYMSPEQARANAELTPQSDQFSFGLVLYELVTGRRAFTRDSAAEIMTAIIREDADSLPATVPAPLRWIIERLLAKDSADRYDSTRDLYRELRQARDRLSETTSGVPTSSTAQIPARPTPRSKTQLLLAALAIALVAAAVAWMIHPATTAGRYRFTPMEVSWENPTVATWSPDGQAFTYVAGALGDRHVFVRYLNSPTPVMLTGASDDWYAAGWSPDGKRVIARGRNPQGTSPRYALFSVPVFGGDPVSIMPLPFRSAYPRVSLDGKALAIPGVEQGKLAVYTSLPVGSPFQRYTPAPFDVSLWSNSPLAEFSADNRWITFVFDALGGRQVWNFPIRLGRALPSEL
jgi:serine/threonine protein kinase